MPEPISVSGSEVSQADLARILPLTTRQIRNLESQGLPHRAEANRKWYPVPEAIVWWRDREIDRALQGVQSSQLELMKARKLEAEAESKELELAERRDLLMLVAHHTRILGLVFDRLRTKLLAIPATWPPLLVGAESPREVQATLQPLINEILDDIRENVGDDPPELDDDDD